MAMIEVRYKPIAGSPIFHKYITYTDNNGFTQYARGGSVEGFAAPFPWGNIATEYGAYVEGTEDWDGGTPHAREPLLIGDDLSAWWTKIVTRMQEIEDGQYEYDATAQNSNTVVDDALRYAGLREPRKEEPTLLIPRPLGRGLLHKLSL